VNDDGPDRRYAHEEGLVEQTSPYHILERRGEHGKSHEEIGRQQHNVFGDGEGRIVELLIEDRTYNKENPCDDEANQSPLAHCLFFVPSAGFARICALCAIEAFHPVLCHIDVLCHTDVPSHILSM